MGNRRGKTREKCVEVTTEAREVEVGEVWESLEEVMDCRLMRRNKQNGL